MKTTLNNLRQRGFTLLEIMIVVGIIAILITIAVPGFIRSRHATRTRAIQQDLVKIDEASRIYVIENRLGPGDVMPTLAELVSQDFLRSDPTPPVAGQYVAATFFTELGTTEPDAYPKFIPSVGGERPEWRHPDLIAADAGT